MVDLNRLWQRFERDLTRVADLAGVDGRSLAGAIEPSARLRIVEAIAEALQDLDDRLPGLSLKTDLTPDAFSITVETIADQEVHGELDARITLRLPEDLKLRIETAATRSGLSLNSWLVRELNRSTSVDISIGKTLRGRGKA